MCNCLYLCICFSGKHSYPYIQFQFDTSGFLESSPFVFINNFSSNKNPSFIILFSYFSVYVFICLLQQTTLAITSTSTPALCSPPQHSISLSNCKHCFPKLRKHKYKYKLLRSLSLFVGQKSHMYYYFLTILVQNFDFSGLPKIQIPTTSMLQTLRFPKVKNVK